MQWRILLLWAMFLARGSFYCAMLPLWEGWDEYAHFAVLQHWAGHRTMPRFDDPIPREVDESMRLTALPGALGWIGAPYLTREQWWQLPPAQRAERQRLLAAIPTAWAHTPAQHPFVSYEAQQPPLYYWLFSLPMRLAAAWPLGSRVLLLRWLSMAVASLAIPLTWLAARTLLGERTAAYAVAMLAAAPGFAIDTSRIANDSLAIPAAALVLWLLSRRAHWIAMGSALGAALLAKAYLLALLPALIVCWWDRQRRLAQALLLAAGLAGWWYVRNLMAGYSFSGWYDHTSGSVLAGAMHIHWLGAADIIAKSFIWFGAWSFLTLKSWIYVVFETLALAGAAMALRRPNPNLKVPLAIACSYLAAIVYGALVFFNAHATPDLPGWYLWPAAGAFAMILAVGLQRGSLWMIGLLALLDLYGVIAAMVPYYAGLLQRGHVDARLFPQALARLHISTPLAAVWMAATVAIPFIAGWPAIDKPAHNRYRKSPAGASSNQDI